MRKKIILILAAAAVASTVLLTGCGSEGQAGPGAAAKTPGAAQTAQKADSSVQGSAEDIAKMLDGMQQDSASITIDDGAGNTTDSAIDAINSALNGSDDDLTGLN